MKTRYVKIKDRTEEQQQAHEKAKADRKATGRTEKGRLRQYKETDSLVLWFYRYGKKGDVLYSEEITDGHAQAHATYNKRKVTTERVAYFPAAVPDGTIIKRMTKITLTNEPPERPKLTELQEIQVLAEELDKLWKAYNSKIDKS